MSIYFNEFEPFAAGWLRRAFPDATVDDRSITDVAADDVLAHGRVHWFAGIGGWELALRIAGWPQEVPVWTGSCPCQPFSAAGRGRAFEDHRDLWPVFAQRIRECRPLVVFGEQVERAVRHGWLDRVQADMEAEGYVVGATVLGAHSVGAPHIRQRLYWVAHRLPDAAHADGRRGVRGGEEGAGPHGVGRLGPGSGGADVRALDDAARERREELRRLRADEPAPLATERPGDARPVGVAGDAVRRDGRAVHGAAAGVHRSSGGSGSVVGVRGLDAGSSGAARPVDDADGGRRGVLGLAEHGAEFGARGLQPDGSGERRLGHWSRFVGIQCGDGRVRRVPASAEGLPEPSLFPLAHGISGRVGRLRAAGNAIVPQVAATFVKAFMDVVGIKEEHRDY